MKQLPTRRGVSYIVEHHIAKRNKKQEEVKRISLKTGEDQKTSQPGCGSAAGKRGGVD